MTTKLQLQNSEPKKRKPSETVVVNYHSAKRRLFQTIADLEDQLELMIEQAEAEALGPSPFMLKQLRKITRDIEELADSAEIGLDI